MHKEPKAQAIKVKIGKWDYIKLTIYKVKRELTGENISKLILNKGLTSRIYKKPNNKTKSPAKR